MPFATGNGGVPLGLSAAANSRPALGTTFNLSVSDIPSGSPLGFLMFGLQQLLPPRDLGPLGMPGCFQYNEQLSVTLLFPQGASSVNFPFTIPNAPGVNITVQAAAFDPIAQLTPLRAVSSNGLRLNFGY